MTYAKKSTTLPERHVKLFKNGLIGVRIPREFELPGEKTIMRKEGDRIVMSRRRHGVHCWRCSAGLEPIEDEFPPMTTCPRSRWNCQPALSAGTNILV